MRTALRWALVAALAQLVLFASAAQGATFGNTAIGTASEAPGAGYKFGSAYTLTEAGTAQSFSLYTRGGNSLQRVTPVIYRVDALGLPAGLVVKGAEVTVGARQAAGWVTSALPATSLTAGSYVLALMSGPNGSQAAGYYNPQLNGGFWNANAYATAPASWGTVNRENSAYSFYVTYTPAAPGTAPANTAPPAITGTTTAGRQLTASTGTWTGSPTSFASQWRRCDGAGANCANIAGAAASTYTLTGADVGATIRVVVTATNGTGSTPATSGATAAVAPAPPANTAAPAVSGTAMSGRVLSTTDGSWTGSPTSFGYQWRRCDGAGASCGDIAGAVASMYTLGPVDVGKTLRSVVTATNAGGPGSATSAATAVVAAEPALPANTARPVITGTAASGRTLTASDGTWTGSPTSYERQWQRCDGAGASCSDVAGATASSYALADGDIGSTVRIVVTARNVTGSAPATSDTTPVVSPAPPANTALPAISGTAMNGRELTATDGSWSGDPTAFAHQWQRCDSAGGACAGIAGATSRTYTLTGADVGRTLRVAVAATGAGGSTTATSGASAVVVEAPSPPSNTAPPTVSGSPVVGQALTGTLGNWAGHPAPALAAQWQACQAGTCTDIASAQGTTYVVRSGDAGRTLRIAVTATNGSGTATAPSAQTQTVTSAPPVVRSFFGTDVPGTATSLPGDGYKFASIYRLQQEGKLVDFRFYARGGPRNQSFVPAIYTTSAGRPSTLVTKGAVVTVTAGSAAAWRTVALPAGVTLQPRDYALALLPGPSGEGAHIYYATVTDAAWWNHNGWPNPTTSWGTINSSAQRWSFHVNYDTTGFVPPPVNEVPPAISGSTFVGQTLTATTGTWANGPSAYAYQWQRCRAGSCSPIAGAAGSTYVLRADDDGATLKVAVTASNDGGLAEAVSAPTVVVTAPAGITIQPFTSHVIDPDPVGAVVEKGIADLDGDGRRDLIIGTESTPNRTPNGNGGIFWYRQPSSGDFSEPWVRHTILPGGKAYEDMAPMDVDADGLTDVVASVEEAVWWYRNPGVIGGAWQSTRIGPGSDENTMETGDLDGDGRREVITQTTIFFQNGPYSWTPKVYNDTYNSIDLLDIGSGNGRINLVGNDDGSHQRIAWFENPRERGGNARTGTWIRHIIGPGYECPPTASCPEGVPASMVTAELNGDGRMDVVVGRAEDEPAPADLRWYEAPADRSQPWTAHVIYEDYESLHNLGLADFDGNGAVDIVAPEQEQSPNRRLSVFYNDGSGAFVEQVLWNQGSHNVDTGDLEGDGDPDIFAGAHGWFGGSHPLLVFRNGRFSGGAQLAPG